MKLAGKILAGLFVLYVGIVVLFESLLGYYQPEGQGTIVITTTEDDGSSHSRVVSKLESGGVVYVAANHWPRGWYHDALDNPKVEVEMDGESRPYRAVAVDGAEHERVDADNELPLFFRFLTGFPPRYFLRLEPRAPSPPS